MLCSESVLNLRTISIQNHLLGTKQLTLLLSNDDKIDSELTLFPYFFKKNKEIALLYRMTLIVNKVSNIYGLRTCQVLEPDRLLFRKN
jgi:hypothetical protein